MNGLLHTHKTERFTGQVIFNKEKNLKEILLKDERYYRHYVSKRLNVGDYVMLSIVNRKPKRTENQNRYYFGVYLPLIADDTGEDVERLHRLFKKKFLSKGSETILGEQVENIGSSTDLSVSDFCTFILEIEKLTEIPAPDTREWSLAPLR